MELMKLSSRKMRSLQMSILGIFFLICAYGIAVYDPLEMLLKSKLEMRKGSFLYELWAKPPLDVYVSVYLFNVTNTHDFLSGKDKKLKLQELGPFVYQEFLENQNATFNENGTLTYVPVRRTEFVPERSIGHPSDFIVTVPNVPYIGATSAASKMGITASIGLSAVTKTMNARPFLNLTAQDYFWGYEDPLISLASKVLPDFLPFDKFGLLDRMFDDGDNLITLNLPQSVKAQEEARAAKEEKERAEAELSRKKRFIFGNSYGEAYTKPTTFEPKVRDYSVDIWNGSPGLNKWGYASYDNKPCNTVRGTYDGTIFPQNISQNEVFNLYRPAFCRTLPIEYSHSGKLWGLDAYYFHLSESAFDTDLNDPNTSCYCMDNKCLKKGLGDVTPCYNVPAALSLPHFYKADKSLLDGVEGMNPKAELHESEIIMQPRLGVPIKVSSRIQLNLLIDSIRFNTELDPFENTVLPIMWAEMQILRLSPNLEFLLNLLFNVAPYVQTGFIFFCILLGISLFAVAIIAYCFVPKKRDLMFDLYPKNNIRYSAINMLPYIKRGLELYDKSDKSGEDEVLETL